VPLLNSLVSFGSLALALVFVFGFVSVFTFTQSSKGPTRWPDRAPGRSQINDLRPRGVSRVCLESDISSLLFQPDQSECKMIAIRYIEV
jgi:hypothetical protein